MSSELVPPDRAHPPRESWNPASLDSMNLLWMASIQALDADTLRRHPWVPFNIPKTEPRERGPQPRSRARLLPLAEPSPRGIAVGRDSAVVTHHRPVSTVSTVSPSELVSQGGGLVQPKLPDCLKTARQGT